MQRAVPVVGRWLLGIFASLGVLAGTMLVVASTPVLKELSFFEALNNFYSSVVRKPLLKLVFSTDVNLPWSNVLLDVGLIWLSLFVAINVFVYRSEDELLWNHIRHNYCFTARPAWYGRGVCTLLKYLYAFVCTPIACLSAFFESLKSQHTLFTRCYMTLNPNEIGRYLRWMGLAIIGLIAFGSVVSKLIPS